MIISWDKSNTNTNTLALSETHYFLKVCTSIFRNTSNSFGVSNSALLELSPTGLIKKTTTCVHSIVRTKHRRLANWDSDFVFTVLCWRSSARAYLARFWEKKGEVHFFGNRFCAGSSCLAKAKMASAPGELKHFNLLSWPFQVLVISI